MTINTININTSFIQEYQNIQFIIDDLIYNEEIKSNTLNNHYY